MYGIMFLSLHVPSAKLPVTLNYVRPCIINSKLFEVSFFFIKTIFMGYCNIVSEYIIIHRDICSLIIKDYCVT